MDQKIKELKPKYFPYLLNEIDDPPDRLYLKGELPSKDLTFLCVVGSRKISDYGKRACSKIIEDLSGLPIVIVSGLALGIDAKAHESAIKVGLKTVAVPGSGLDPSVIYPKSHLNLSEKIVRSGGALLSEFEPNFEATKWSFPKRNRIMAGISHGVLVIEAQKKSGSLITAKLGLEYNREIMAVPGSIFSSLSSGTNYLIQQGAYAINNAKDIQDIFGIKKNKDPKTELMLSDEEKKILKFIISPINKNELIKKSKMDVSKVNTLISSLEIKGAVYESGGNIYPEKN